MLHFVTTLGFRVLNKKCKKNHFEGLYIHANSIKSIPEINFGEVYFDKIDISNLNQLKSIHKNAFIGIANHIKSFMIKETPKLLTTSKSADDLKESINQLINCKEIRLPSFEKVFKRFNLTKLNKITISGFNSQIKIQTIDEDSFYYCNQIEFIAFQYNEIKLIKKNAFRLKSQNNEEVYINFLNNKLKNGSFENGWFSDNRPIKLYLYENEMNYLDEQVFNQFFDCSSENIICSSELNLNDPNNNWLFGKNVLGKQFGFRHFEIENLFLEKPIEELNRIECDDLAKRSVKCYSNGTLKTIKINGIVEFNKILPTLQLVHTQ